jgi:DNA polymerase-3 subunit epsilon
MDMRTRQEPLPRQQAQRLAKQLLIEDIVILDTETTGLKSDDEIVEISIINADGDILLDTLIKPQKKIPDEAIKIHSITNEDVQHAPTWKDVYKKYREIVKGKPVIIYNKSYDTRIIRQTCKKYELPTPRIETECAMLLYAQYHGEINERTGDYKWHHLTNAAYDNNIKVIGRSHRALTDTKTTLALIKHMAYEECQLPIYSPKPKYDPYNDEYTQDYKNNSFYENYPAPKKESKYLVFFKFSLVVVTIILMIKACQILP